MRVKPLIRLDFVFTFGNECSKDFSREGERCKAICADNTFVADRFSRAIHILASIPWNVRFDKTRAVAGVQPIIEQACMS
jgi:hypothetical protein